MDHQTGRRNKQLGDSDTRKSPNEVEVLLDYCPSFQRGTTIQAFDQLPASGDTKATAKGIDGTARTLAIAVLALVLPLSAIVVILIYIILAHPVDAWLPSTAMPETISDALADGSSALFVNYSATRLTTFASWASTGKHPSESASGSRHGVLLLTTNKDLYRSVHLTPRVPDDSAVISAGETSHGTVPASH